MGLREYSDIVYMSVNPDPDSDIPPKELHLQIQQINKEIEKKNKHYIKISEDYDPYVPNSTHELYNVSGQIGNLQNKIKSIENSLPEEEREINLTEKLKPKPIDLDEPVVLPEKVKPNPNNTVFSWLFPKGGKTRRKIPKKRTRVKRRKQSRKSRRIRS